MARNSLGETISREARMSVRSDSQSEPTRPQFVQIPAGHVFFDEDSDFIVMHCIASGVPKPQITWNFNGQPISRTSEHIELHVNGTLVIHNPIEEDEGEYRCEATNTLGSITTVANYKINGKTMIKLSKPETGLIFLKTKNFPYTKKTFLLSFLIALLPVLFSFCSLFPLKLTNKQQTIRKRRKTSEEVNKLMRILPNW